MDEGILINCFPNHKGKTINEVLKKYNNSKKSYLENDTLTLINALKENYFFTMGTISAPIYKTNIWDSQALREGYSNIINMFPHYPLILKSIENNYSTYKTKSEIITVSENDNNWEKSLLTWVIGWLNSASLIKDKKIQKIASQFLEGGPVIVSMWNIIAAKSLDEDDLKTKIISLNSVILKLNGWFKGIIYSILLILTYLIPKKFCKMIYNAHKN